MSEEEEDNMFGESGEDPGAAALAQQSLIDQIFSGVSMVSGIGSMVGQYAHYMMTHGYKIQGFLGIRSTAAAQFHFLDWANKILSNPAFAAVGIALSVYSAYRLSQSIIANGFSKGAAFNMGMTAFGLATGTTSFLASIGVLSLGPGMLPLMTNPIGWAIAGGIIATTLLVAWLTRKDPHLVAAEKQNKALEPVVWSAGPLIFVAAGTLALMVGWQKSSPSPAYAEMTMPSYHLAQMAQQSGGILSSFNPNAQGPVTLVDKTSGQVMIVSPRGVDIRGNPLSVVQMFSLRDNLKIEAPRSPDQSYIPFFIYDAKGKPQPNPEIDRSFQTQMSLLAAVNSGRMDGGDAMNGILVASAANKYETNPTNGF